MNYALALTATPANDHGVFDFTMPPAPLRQSELGMAGPAPRPTAGLINAGKILLDGAELRRLRQSRLLSQKDLADDCWRRRIRVSIATIKRAESGRAVRFRVAHELARCFDVPVTQIVRI